MSGRRCKQIRGEVERKLGRPLCRSAWDAAAVAVIRKSEWRAAKKAWKKKAWKC